VSEVKVKVRVVSNYPWSGKFDVFVDPERPIEFGLRIRIPGWAGDATFDMPGSDKPAEFEDGYAVFHRTWKAGEVLHAELEMTPKWVRSSPKVFDNLGRACLTYGPLVYCLEEHDLGAKPQLFTADVDAEPTVAHKAKLLGGVTTITVDGVVDSCDETGELYAEAESIALTPKAAEFIPYFAWCNRGPNHMLVWVRSV
jgi:uncharacterized protein